MIPSRQTHYVSHVPSSSSKDGHDALQACGVLVILAGAAIACAVPASCANADYDNHDRHAATLVVCPSAATDPTCQYIGNLAMQDAVDAASNGDTILIKAGIYGPQAFRDVPYERENAVVRGYIVVENKQLNFTGEAGTILDGSTGKESTAFVVNGGIVTFSNLVIRNFNAVSTDDDIYDGHGIFIINSHVTVQDTTIENFGKMGFSVREGSTVEASNVKIVDGHVGIWIEEFAKLGIENAVIRNNDSAGIAAYAGSRTRVHRSILEGNQDDGIYTEGDAIVDVTDTVIMRNKPYGINATENSRVSTANSILYANEENVNPLMNHRQVRAGVDTLQLAEYRVVGKYAGPDGGYDYVSIDSAEQRVFVARKYGVMAIDLDSKKVIPRLLEGQDVSAVMIVPGTDLMVITNWAGDTATIFDRNSGAIKAEIPTGRNPDAALYEAMSGLTFVMNSASANVTVIDTKETEAIATIPVGGKPEAAISDEQGNVYINIEDTAEIVVIDVASLRARGSYGLRGCVEPTGLAIDAKTGLLISACKNAIAKLIHAKTGEDRGMVPIGNNADGVIFHAAWRLAYVPAKDGTLTIFRLDDEGKATVIDVVATQEGARTAALDSETGQLYLPVAKYVINESGETVQVPGTFNVFVIAPGQAGPR